MGACVLRSYACRISHRFYANPTHDVPIVRLLCETGEGATRVVDISGRGELHVRVVDVSFEDELSEHIHSAMWYCYPVG